ncbi:hypothetical protein, conserved [Trypanosoma brucei brucei TREU927]|uniref:Uncharacterized protein n=1 Tax=Trypanosoma brucei brucei (strain 927/4 GUTat10.1) TaxID=185431 RepID=Q584A4_TRYB2|nr:hypothetical protein, conserved [Trypanosoma brucei brucei TREU927]AAX79813.1 hypothetical protein, conserved [Trypanosoma brucei]AAZ10918.1 hypothetical protein, conserved [Trypanosoma brucei brucei TREU927]
MMPLKRGMVVACLVVVCAYGQAEGDIEGKGKALTQSDADAICNVVKQLRELANNVTRNMKLGEKIVDNGENVATYYSTRVEAKKMLVKVLGKLIPEEGEKLSVMGKLLSDMEEPIQVLKRSITNVNASLGCMSVQMWNLTNMSDSYAYWVKDMVELFAQTAFGSGNCCLVVDGGATGDCIRGGKRGSVPTDCTIYPPQRSEGGLAEYKNPLDEGLTLTMGNAGDEGEYPLCGCFITTTNDTYSRGKKSLIYELSGGLFYTQNNRLMANFTFVGKEFQELIDPLRRVTNNFSAWNTSITRQRAVLDGLLLKLKKEIRHVLEKEKNKAITEALGSTKNIPWFGNESGNSDGMGTQPTLRGVSLFLFFLVFF